MLILSKENQDKIFYSSVVLNIFLVFGYFYVVIFTESSSIKFDGVRLSIGIIATALIYSMFFKLIQKKSEEIAIGILLLILSIMPIFVLDYLGGIGSPYVFIIFPLLIIGFILGSWWGSAIEAFLLIYLFIGMAFEGLSVGLGLIVTSATLAISLIFYYIGYVYRQVLVERNELESSNVKLSAGQNKEEALLASIADGVYVVDMDRNLTMFNAAAERITGWQADESVGLKCWTVMNLKNDTDISICQKDCPALNVWNTGENIHRDDTCFIAKRGKNKIQISSSYAPIKDKNGVNAGAICVFRDITDRKLVERLRSEFVSTASHELRTPITAMEGYMELIENDKICKVDDKAREYLTKARNTAMGMSNLVKNLLTVTKIEEGKINTNVTKFSIHELAEEVVEALEPSAKSKGLSLNIIETPDPKVQGERVLGRFINVVADKEQIREVFYNIVENAMKFTLKGGATINILYDKDFATVCVADTGIGIPAEGQKHMFEKFYRYDNTATREVGGTGLGLFITRSIVEMFGGSIWLESQVGKGTKFYFTVPRSLD